ncbi:hypothetical protein NPIL_444401 [Nephila pilipes]|uniref:Uncharacterized protein n=1 Tax=Nephila pilipes TaxID=299642 RepID=A0A8X6MMC8_NEPPI|nr:hypothetical protein NPIL_444401 [Nephila pilipes]
MNTFSPHLQSNATCISLKYKYCKHYTAQRNAHKRRTFVAFHCARTSALLKHRKQLAIAAAGQTRSTGSKQRKYRVAITIAAAVPWPAKASRR